MRSPPKASVAETMLRRFALLLVIAVIATPHVAAQSAAPSLSARVDPTSLVVPLERQFPVPLTVTNAGPATTLTFSANAAGPMASTVYLYLPASATIGAGETRNYTFYALAQVASAWSVTFYANSTTETASAVMTLRAVDGGPLKLSANPQAEAMGQSELTRIILTLNNTGAAEPVSFRAHSWLRADAPGDAFAITPPSPGTMQTQPGNNRAFFVQARSDQTKGDYGIWVLAETSNGTYGAYAYLRVGDPVGSRVHLAVQETRLSYGLAARGNVTVKVTGAEASNSALRFTYGDVRGSFDAQTIRQDPRMAGNVTLPMKLQNATAGSYTLFVKVQLDASPTDGDVVTLPIDIIDEANPPRREVALSWNTTESTVEPGKSALVYLNLSEQSGVHQSVNLVIVPVTAASSQVFATPNQTRFEFEPRARTTIGVSVGAVSNASPGDYRFRARALDRYNGTTLGESNFTLHVVAPPLVVIGVNLSWHPSVDFLVPGGNLTMNLTLSESAGAHASVHLEIESPDASLTATPAAGDFELAPGETATIQARIDATSAAALGEHLLRATLTDRATGVQLAQQGVRIPVVARAITEPPVASLRLTSEPAIDANASDALLRVEAHAVNDGNVTLDVTLGVESDSLKLGPATASQLHLAPGESGTLIAGVPLNGAQSPGRYALRLVASARDAQATTWTNLTLRAAAAPLLLDAPAGLEVPANGSATLRVRVLSFDAAPRGLSFNVTLDGGFTAEKVGHNVLIIPPGGEIQLVYLISAPQGAEPGALGSIRLESPGASATTALRVTTAAIPPLVTPQHREPSGLEIASTFVAEHPGAGASMLVAGSALALAPLLRRQGARMAFVAAALPLYTRLAKPALLDEKQRAKLHAIIRERPGTHYSALRDATGLGAGAVVHHLRILEKHGIITSQRDGKLRRYYSMGQSPGARPAAPTPEQAEILAILAEAGPQTRPQIAAKLGLSQQGVSYHVKNLERAGRVVVRGHGGTALVNRVLDSEPVKRTQPDP